MDLNINNIKIIHIRLLDEIVDVWRPTKAIELENEIFQVLPTIDYDKNDEEWEFVPGSIVKCATKEFDQGHGLVAIALA